MEQTIGTQTLLLDKKSYNIFMIKNHTDIINALIKKNDYKSYLEIGVHRRFMNFDKIEVEYKVGVDPDPLAEVEQITSDEFFDRNIETFDIIFIDGLHHSDQALKDIQNSIAILNDGGSIVVHDCSPTSEDMQMIPQDDRLVWTGDTWKAWVTARCLRNDVSMEVVDTDWGCGIIQKKNSEVQELTYKILDENRKQILNLISVEEFEKKYLNL